MVTREDVDRVRTWAELTAAATAELIEDFAGYINSVEDIHNHFDGRTEFKGLRCTRDDASRLLDAGTELPLVDVGELIESVMAPDLLRFTPPREISTDLVANAPEAIYLVARWAVEISGRIEHWSWPQTTVETRLHDAERLVDKLSAVDETKVRSLAFCARQECLTVAKVLDDSDSESMEDALAEGESGIGAVDGLPNSQPEPAKSLADAAESVEKTCDDIVTDDEAMQAFIDAIRRNNRLPSSQRQSQKALILRVKMLYKDDRSEAAFRKAKSRFREMGVAGL